MLSITAGPITTPRFGRQATRQEALQIQSAVPSQRIYPPFCFVYDYERRFFNGNGFKTWRSRQDADQIHRRLRRLSEAATLRPAEGKDAVPRDLFFIVEPSVAADPKRLQWLTQRLNAVLSAVKYRFDSPLSALLTLPDTPEQIPLKDGNTLLRIPFVNPVEAAFQRAIGA